MKAKFVIVLVVWCFLLTLVPSAQAKKKGPKIKARLQVDSAIYDEDKSRIGNGTNIRRGILGIKGKLKDLLDSDELAKWTYKVGYDFADNEVSAKDLWLGYEFNESFSVQIGNFKEPFSHENLMSSAGTVFMERSLADALSTGRKMGFGVFKNWTKYSIQLGVFSEKVDEKRDEEDEGLAFTGRVTAQPIYDKESKTVLHFGLAASSRHLSIDDSVYDLDSTLEIEVNDMKLLETGDINNARKIVRLGGEVAFVSKKYLYFMSEVIQLKVKREAEDDLTFTGGAFTLGRSLWGPMRYFDRGDRTLGKVNMSKRQTALELALRYSWLDLVDGGVAGGVGKNLGVALNWYPQKLIRFSLNVIQSQVDRFGFENKPLIYALRAQINI